MKRTRTETKPTTEEVLVIRCHLDVHVADYAPFTTACAHLDVPAAARSKATWKRIADALAGGGKLKPPPIMGICESVFRLLVTELWSGARLGALIQALRCDKTRELACSCLSSILLDVLNGGINKYKGRECLAPLAAQLFTDDLYGKLDVDAAARVRELVLSSCEENCNVALYYGAMPFLAARISVGVTAVDAISLHDLVANCTRAAQSLISYPDVMAALLREAVHSPLLAPFVFNTVASSVQRDATCVDGWIAAGVVDMCCVAEARCEAWTAMVGTLVTANRSLLVDLVRSKRS
jgi:hypothetical protein